MTWAPTALRALERLPEKFGTAVVEFAYGALSENPRHVGHALRVELEGKHSASRGDFRIIYEIEDEVNLVTILMLDHRSEVYRSR
jgi:mRNA-degrading endonuclease RelE of RelBE toxin-antitoxin system